MAMRTLLRLGTIWLAALPPGLAVGCASSAEEGGPIVLTPGQDIQAIVSSAPEGARFLFEPGIYRQQTIYPKHRQAFTGQDGVILSGAMELTSWTKVSGLWQADGLPLPLDAHGECVDGGNLCTLREDLFVDGRLYERVASLLDLGPERWYYEDGRAYLADDPTGRSVELGVTPLAFGGDAEHVVIESLVVEKYAPDAQYGAIHLEHARGWLISDVTVRWNHGLGLFFGPGTRVIGGSFNHNGQMGMGGHGEGSAVEGVEIAFNNYAGYDAGWEAGGTKFANTTGLVVRGSCVHHNEGPGLWTDIDNIHTLYEDNKVFLNANDGIKHEISYDAVIRNNVVAQNGTSGFDVWLWGSQILIQNSGNVEVYGNLVEVSGRFGNGIGVIQQDRGDGAHGPWSALNVAVHDNTIAHRGSYGQNGLVTDTDGDGFWDEAGNSFDRNTYVVADGDHEYWTSHDRGAVWDDFLGLGYEHAGELIVGGREPVKLSCAR
jgi:Right handed beta helix region